MMRDDVNPVIQPLPWSPLALREGITKELQSMLGDGIIELDDASPWISNLVIAKKKLGGDQVFSALLQHNLTLNSEKLTFTVPQVQFVGFRLSARGISPQMSNIEAIHCVPEPASPSHRWHHSQA
ncbi:hypothetical protein SKAU_G00211660 [Synaphobranchus kaupii]|uniref:Reverse transcriptase n=1 Tax=Synaphobranchus kaupii TaxID=118154 RepID=A0A9Q1IUM4_SYNKA|nr:hypothetical protein SKAU_G00211660 [Synaphobranchus kaupii]